MAISRLDMERQLRNMGGIMSLQEPRQGYFIGKLVKKAKKAVKKVVKSPIGKAAILGGLTLGVPGTGFKGLLGAGKGGGLGSIIKRSLFGQAASKAAGPFGYLQGSPFTEGLLGKLGLTKGGGSFGLTGLGKIAGIGGLAGLAGLMASGEQDEDEIDFSKLDRGEGLDIDRIVRLARMNDPQFRFLPGAEFTETYAEGGGVGSLAMNKENVKQKFISDEAGAIPKKMKDGEGGVLPSDMGKLKRNDFDSDEDYQRYLRQLNRKAEGGIMNPMTMLGLSLLDKGSEMGMKEMEKQKKLMELLQKLRMTDPDKELRKRGELEELRRIEAEKRIDKAEGGIMDLGGNEMDLRGGGFVPIGAKEKADDVPARLSKNEFVMTADAVRAAGGGSVDKGADKMYNLMKDLEAQV